MLFSFCIGLATLGNIEYEMRQKMKNTVGDCMYPSFGTVRNDETIEKLVDNFKHYPFIVVSKGSINYYFIYVKI